ncbi:MAG: hypothetical protein K0S53_2614 [Bacteroidetes bacterium]|jgi:hypothetical protein|nr:hypothetical protein [Bacteroidota bacterium]
MPTSTTADQSTKSEIKNGDTLSKTADTIIVKDGQTNDTLVKFKSHSFTDYAVAPIEIKFDKKLDFSTYEFKKMYRTATKDGVDENGVNFAGHFCFVSWGCGSPCKLSAVVDLKTGKVYNGLPSGIGYSFKKDSRLMIVNPPDSTTWYDITVPYTIPEEYEWTGKEFKRIKTSS